MTVLRDCGLVAGVSLYAVDEKVVSLLGNRAQPLNNNFDSDAAYCNATGTFII